MKSNFVIKRDGSKQRWSDERVCKAFEEVYEKTGNVPNLSAAVEWVRNAVSELPRPSVEAVQGFILEYLTTNAEPAAAHIYRLLLAEKRAWHQSFQSINPKAEAQKAELLWHGEALNVEALRRALGPVVDRPLQFHKALAAVDARKVVLPANPALGWSSAWTNFNRLRVFSEVAYMLFRDCEVGVSLRYAHLAQLPPISMPSSRVKMHVVQPGPAGHADALGALWASYFFEDSDTVHFDFSCASHPSRLAFESTTIRVWCNQHKFMPVTPQALATLFERLLWPVSLLVDIHTQLSYASQWGVGLPRDSLSQQVVRNASHLAPVFYWVDDPDFCPRGLNPRLGRDVNVFDAHHDVSAHFNLPSEAGQYAFDFMGAERWMTDSSYKWRGVFLEGSGDSKIQAYGHDTGWALEHRVTVDSRDADAIRAGYLLSWALATKPVSPWIGPIVSRKATVNLAGWDDGEEASVEGPQVFLRSLDLRGVIPCYECRAEPLAGVILGGLSTGLEGHPAKRYFVRGCRVKAPDNVDFGAQRDCAFDSDVFCRDVWDMQGNADTVHRVKNPVHSGWTPEEWNV